MFRLSRPRRPHRSGEWTGGKAVTFIVTLAAHSNVTLAARRTGMSRKSAYALKSRDPAFAAAWDAALQASGSARRRGDKVYELNDPTISPGQGDSALARTRYPRHAELDSASMNTRARESARPMFNNPQSRQNVAVQIRRDSLARNFFFARLARRSAAQ